MSRSYIAPMLLLCTALFAVDVVLAVVNLPGVERGGSLSIFAFGFCCAMAGFQLGAAVIGWIWREL